MVDAPERLWVQPENRTPVDEDPRHAGPHDVEYVRADLYEQVKRERDDAKQALQNEIVAHGNTIRGKAEHLAGAEPVDREPFIEFPDGSCERTTPPDASAIREALEAIRALSGLDGELCKASATIMSRMADIHQTADAALAGAKP